MATVKTTENQKMKSYALSTCYAVSAMAGGNWKLSGAGWNDSTFILLEH